MANYIKKLVKLIKATDSNILVLKTDDEQVFDTIANAVGNLGVKMLIIRVPDLDQVELLNETDMARYGWFKRENLEKLQGPVKPEAVIRIHRHRPYDEKYKNLDDEIEAIDE